MSYITIEQQTFKDAYSLLDARTGNLQISDWTVTLTSWNRYCCDPILQMRKGNLRDVIYTGQYPSAWEQESMEIAKWLQSPYFRKYVMSPNVYLRKWPWMCQERNSFMEGVGLARSCSRIYSRGGREVLRVKELGTEWGLCAILYGGAT